MPTKEKIVEQLFRLMALRSVLRRRAHKEREPMKITARPRRRRTGAMLAALALATAGLTGAQAATAHPAFAAPSEACTKAQMKLDTARGVAVIVCTVAAMQAEADPLADAACLAAVAAELVSLRQRNAACSASNAQNLSDSVSADPGAVDAALAAAGDTSPQPGDVLDTTFASYDGQDSSGDYVYTLDITGWEDSAQWGGDGGGATCDPGAGSGFGEALVCSATA
jgi:hypothetical protein